jgi:hypothetical protein
MISESRLIKCDKVVKYIKQDLNKIKDYSPLQNKILKSEYCIRLIKDIKHNLMKLFTFDEIEYVRETLGKTRWESVLYYIDKYDALNRPKKFYSEEITY